ncbi:MAG: hypothetical protein JWQ12_382 [Glaciihabitans sp.]|nr:hypothetical protein [Glaciihabitans sp.]
MTRDPALLAGATARQWQRRGRWATVAAAVPFVGMVLTAGILHSPIPVVIGFIALAIVVLVAGRLCAGIAVRKMQLEAASGYNTMLDLNGYDLRDGVTGELLRSHRQPPPAQGAWASAFGPSRAQLDAYRAARSR